MEDFIAKVYEKLKCQPLLKAGDHIYHKHEDGTWEKYVVEQPLDTETGKPTGGILFYTTKDDVSFVASVAGRLMKRDNLSYDAPKDN